MTSSAKVAGAHSLLQDWIASHDANSGFEARYVWYRPHLNYFIAFSVSLDTYAFDPPANVRI